MEDEHKKKHQYLKYTGLAFQLAGVIFLSILIGKWLDDKVGTQQPYFTMTLTLLFFGGYMYKLIKELS